MELPFLALQTHIYLYVQNDAELSSDYLIEPTKGSIMYENKQNIMSVDTIIFLHIYDY